MYCVVQWSCVESSAAKLCNRPSIRGDHSSQACGEERERVKISHRLHWTAHGRPEESWLPGWLIVSRIASLSNNDGLLADLPLSLAGRTSRSQFSKLCAKKRLPRHRRQVAREAKHEEERLKTLLTFQFFSLNSHRT